MALPASFTRWSLRLASGLLGLLAVTIAPAAAHERIAAPQEDVRSQLSADLQCVPPDAALMLSLNVGKVWRSKSARLLRTWGHFQEQVYENLLNPMGLDAGDIERVVLVQYQKALSYMVKGTRPLNRAKLVHYFARRAHEGTLQGKPYYINEEDWTGLVFLDARTLLVGKVNEVEGLMSSFQNYKQPLSAGQEAVVAGRELVIEIHPAQLVRFVPQVEPAIRLLLQTSSILLQADFGANEMRAEAHIDCSSGRLARAVETLLHKLPDQVQEPLTDISDYCAKLKNTELGFSITRALDQFCHAVATGLKDLKWERQEGRLHTTLKVHAGDSAMAVAILGSVCDIRTAAAYELTIDNGEQIRKLGLAMLEHHRKTGRLPAAALCDGHGKPLLSWRVALLPYLGQGELYKKFQLDEPWDSENNRKLIPRMPEVFQSYRADGTPTTPYQVFVGKGAAFEGKKGKRLRDFKDGPEQTILIALAARCVPWTKPEDLHYAADKPLPVLDGQSSMTVALANGQVVVLPESFRAIYFTGEFRSDAMKTKPLRALITRNGGDQSEAQAFLSQCGTPPGPQDPPTIQPAVYPPPYLGGVPLPQYLPVPPPNPYGLPPSLYPNTLPPPPYGIPGPLPGMPVMPLPPPEGGTRPDPYEDQPR